MATQNLSIQDAMAAATSVAFIGTRQPTDAQALHCIRAASRAARLGKRFVSGGAQGIDSIAQNAFVSEGSGHVPRIFRPGTAVVGMSHFDQLDAILTAALGQSWRDAIRAKGEYVHRLALRNVCIVQEADIVLAYPSPQGGGTAQGIAIAAHLQVPCFDMNQYLA